MILQFNQQQYAKPFVVYGLASLDPIPSLCSQACRICDNGQVESVRSCIGRTEKRGDARDAFYLTGSLELSHPYTMPT